MESNMDRIDIEIQQEERIMSFLRGKMSEAEETEFMNDLKKDAELKAKAISIARLAKGISQVGTENDKVLKEALMSSDELAIRNIAEHVTALEQHQESAASPGLHCCQRLAGEHHPAHPLHAPCHHHVPGLALHGRETLWHRARAYRRQGRACCVQVWRPAWCRSVACRCDCSRLTGQSA